MRHPLRGRIVIASAVAGLALLAPLPVAAGFSLGSGAEDLVRAGLPLSPSPTPAPTEPALAVPAQPVSPSPQPASPSRQPVSAVPITSGSGERAEVAITLDADLSEHTLYRIRQGSVPAQVNFAVLDYLEATGTPSTVFVTGLWALEYPDVMDRMAGNPIYELANHSWDHSAWTDNCYGLPTVQGDPAVQVQMTAEVIKQHTGTYPSFFRFPGLCHNQAHVDFVAQLGERTVDFDLSGSDAFAKSPSAVAQSLLSQVRPGSIIVLHLNGAPAAPVTSQILAELVPGLTAMGLQPVTMTELMR